MASDFMKKIIVIISIIFLLVLIVVLSLYWLYYLGPLKLTYAASKGEIATIKYIVNLGISPNKDAFLQGSPVNCAIANNKIASVEKLYSCGASLNNIDGYGIAPIHAAVIYNQCSILKWLIEDKTKNVKINLLSRDKKTALDYAIEEKKQKIIDALRECGAKTAAELKMGEKNGDAKETGSQPNGA
jgi:flagellar basal body-associated protein FliL